MPARGQQFGIGQFPPAAAALALGHEDAAGLNRRPVLQAIGQPTWVFSQRLPGTKIDGAVGTALDRHCGIVERDGAQRMNAGSPPAYLVRSSLCFSCLRAHFWPGLTFAVLWSR